MMCLTSSLSNTCTQLDYVERSIQVWVVLPWTAYYNWLIIDSVDYDKDDGSAAVDLLLNTECHCPSKLRRIMQIMRRENFMLQGQHYWHKRVHSSQDRFVAVLQRRRIATPDKANLLAASFS